MPGIIDRYLIREVLHGWFAVTLILWLVLVSQRMVRYLADAIEGKLPGDVIFILLGVKTIWYFVYIMPFALALGVVVGLGRLYRDNEMVVLRACGMGPARLYQPLLGLGIVVAVLLGCLSLYVSPGISAYGNHVLKQAELRADLTALGAGRFNEIRNGKMTFYAEQLSEDKLRMEKLFIYALDHQVDDAEPQVLTARSAYRMRDEESGSDFLVLVDGFSFEGQPGSAAWRMMKFGRYGVRVKTPKVGEQHRKREDKPTSELLGSSDLLDRVELQWRLSVPVSVMVLILLAVPLSRVGSRKGRFGQLLVAVLLFVVYFNLLGTARVWVEQGAVNPVIGIWWVPMLPVLLTLLLLNANRIFYLFRRRP
jgi:lipopolysaccharide export system permease protein